MSTPISGRSSTTVTSRLKRLQQVILGYRDAWTGRSYGLNDLDRKLGAILTKRHGFFIEAGANDGKNQSNTLFLERQRGWSGILIEPVPDLYERCLAARSNCHVFHAALVAADYGQSTIDIHACGLMSTVVGAMKSEDATQAHLQKGAEAHNLTPSLVTVPARTLSSICDEVGVTSIDLLSLDVEGFEGNALRGLDLDRHAPSYILVEERFPEDVAGVLSSRYDSVGLLSHHDRLYARRT